jgi:crotonobetainyl-CoA:carnitine CoA-transferase CaiB-like acyl-CoA transferase
MHFAQGMMLALAARDRTGRGQVVDSCLLNSAVALHLQEGTTYLNTGREYPRPPAHTAHPHNTPLYGYFRTKDGAWLALVGEYYVDQPWRRAARALGLPDAVRDDPRFATIEGLAAHAQEVAGLMTAAFQRLTRDEALERLEAEDLLAAPVNDYPALFADPQVLHNEMVLETELEGVGTVRFVGMPVTVGQHNERLLGELGLGEDEIRALQDDGVVGSENLRHAAGGPAAW